MEERGVTKPARLRDDDGGRRDAAGIRLVPSPLTTAPVTTTCPRHGHAPTQNRLPHNPTQESQPNTPTEAQHSQVPKPPLRLASTLFKLS